MGTVTKPASVLVVEDELLISEMVSESLTERGFAVHAVANAADALACLAADPDIDILFTDINLPGALDGSQLAWRARELRPDLPVVYASGRAQALAQLAAVPGSIFMAKPYLPSHVCRVLKQLIAQ